MLPPQPDEDQPAGRATSPERSAPDQPAPEIGGGDRDQTVPVTPAGDAGHDDRPTDEATARPAGSTPTGGDADPATETGTEAETPTRTGIATAAGPGTATVAETETIAETETVAEAGSEGAVPRGRAADADGTAGSDPTLPLPVTGPDEADMPTPVDPWAGVAVDPWLAPSACPHSGAASAEPAVGHATPADPPGGPGAPVRPRLPQPRQLPATRPLPVLTEPSGAAPPPVAPPPTPRSRRRRAPAPPPQPAPPGWQPPPGYVAVPVRRRRRWPWVMLALTLLTVACCCGVPGYYVWPVWTQYPARPADPFPEEILDLRLQDGRDDQRVVGDLKTDLRMRNWIAEKTFAAVYRDGRGKRVTIFGTTGFRIDPESDIRTEFDRLTKEYDIEDVRDIDSGVRGEYRRCGVGREQGESVVVCTAVDHGSMISGLFTLRNVEESMELLVTMRGEVVLRD